MLSTSIYTTVYKIFQKKKTHTSQQVSLKENIADWNWKRNLDNSVWKYIKLILIYSFSFICLGQERTIMDNREEVIIITNPAIVVGLAVVAHFLINTNRFQKAIDLWKECLILLKDLKKDKRSKVYRLIYTAIFNAYRLVSDYANAVRYGRKLLLIFHDTGDMVKEGQLSLTLGRICHSQNNLEEALEFYERAIDISVQTGDRKLEAEAYRNLGVVFNSLGEYVKAKECLEKALAIRTETGDRKREAAVYRNLGGVFNSLGEYVKAKECLEKALPIIIETGDKEGEVEAYGNLGVVCNSLGENVKAKECLEKALAIRTETGDRKIEAVVYRNLGGVFNSLGEYVKAKECLEKALPIIIETGDRKGEGEVYRSLGVVFNSLGEYVKAKECLEKALPIIIETGDRKGEGEVYRSLGVVFNSLGEYVKAKECLEKALPIIIETGDRKREAVVYRHLGVVFNSLGEYVKAKECLEKALSTTIETGDKKGEADVSRGLGVVLNSLGEYVKAKECIEKELAIRIETGDRKREAAAYRNLGVVFDSLGECVKAKECLEKALPTTIETGDRKGGADVYRNLGVVLNSLGEYVKAKECIEKELAIRIETGDRKREAAAYRNLGVVFHSLGEYVKAKECLEKALPIIIETCDKEGEGEVYCKLGGVFNSLGEYVKAKECLEIALAIRIETGDRKREAEVYCNLGGVFNSLGEYVKANNCLEKALPITIETGDRKGEAEVYRRQGGMFHLLGECVKAKQCLKKACDISIEIGDRRAETVDYGELGGVFTSLGKYPMAKKYLDKALTMSTEIGDRVRQADNYERQERIFRLIGDYNKAKECQEKSVALKVCNSDIEKAMSYIDIGVLLRMRGENSAADEYFEKALLLSKDRGNKRLELKILCWLSKSKLSQNKTQEAFRYLYQCIEKFEDLRNRLGENDHFKACLLEAHGTFPYEKLSRELCFNGNPFDALYVEELARARGLADLMAAQYSVETPISANPQSWSGITNVIRKESNCACLYIAYDDKLKRHCCNHLFFWIVKTSGEKYFKFINVDKTVTFPSIYVNSVGEFFAKGLENVRILPDEDCEDRSLNIGESQLISSEQESPAALRPGEKEDGKNKDLDSQNLSLCYKFLIAPVVDLLEEPEVIIVPHRGLYQVPFAALGEEKGKYLSDDFRIRIVPSLTTLKVIQDSPPDYHSQTGALIVGDPEVGWVLHDGKRKNIIPLPFARKEVKMIGRLLGVAPLIGDRATKEAVLQAIHSVSLIHIAAHGNAESGQIALSPVGCTNRIPQEEDYFLTMSDISKVELRAKLLVLSCCHSGRGQIKAEGVIGIARAFLGSGARSVLAALWGIEDTATEQLMSRFYEHLVRGESASESLHQAMKWMRNNGFEMVCQWAPFMLIGDNVTFDVAKLR